MVRTLSVAAAAVLAILGQSTAQERVTEALDGTDPVLLVQGKDVLGSPQFRAVHEGFEYLFASAATKAEFEKNPAKYAIQLGGLCARMGRTASGNPSDYLVHDGKIYIFGSDSCHKAFAAAPARFLPPPAEPMPPGHAAQASGRALLDRAAAAIGAGLDDLTSYAEARSQVVKRMDAEVPVNSKTTWRFPDAVRTERTMRVGDRTMTSASVATRDGAWFEAQGRTYPMIPAARANLIVDHQRQLVPFLRSRKEGLAAALGRQTFEGAELERVRVRRGDLDAVLAIDPASAQPRSLSFAERNSDGEFGLYTIVYEDYRTVDGLTVPFKIRATFNGQSDPSQSWTVNDIRVNPPLDAGLFEHVPRHQP